MTRAIVRATFALALLLLVACQAILAADPPIPKSAENPCGGGVCCETPGLYCPDNNTCGDDPDSVGCPKGYCCFVGLGAGRDGGGRAQVVVTGPQQRR